MPLAEGLRLGPYELVHLLGAGGMGEVYRARDLRLGRDVAVKVLPPGFSADPHALERFHREARAISSLAHANICTLFDIGCQDYIHFIVMEFLEGQTLRESLAEGPLTLSPILLWGTEIASALDAAHCQGIVHRDIKPANIFITRQGRAKLLDFGLAKFQKTSAALDTIDEQTLTNNELTMHGVPVGTVAYMSPEQAQGLPVSPRSDLFSLGAVLYEMATSCRAFAGNSAAAVFAAILHSTPVPLTRVNSAMPRELEHVVARLLEKSPEARYASARELSAALEVLRDVHWSGSEIQVLPTPVATASLPERPQSLAVLPLVDLSPDPSRDYFVDGLTEALITAVARVGGMRVTSRTSSMCYKDTKKTVPVIAQELNVDAVLEGSVLRSGERLRLTCRLVDPRTEQLLWSESFDRRLHDILSLHDEVTQAVASQVRSRIQEHSHTSLSSVRSINPEAYDSFLRGRFFWNKRNETSLRKAIECFQHALDLDPLYAPAYAGLADSYFYLGYSFGRMDPKVAMPRAKAAALRALELDSHLADAHCSLGLVQATYEWEWAASEASYLRALALNPSLGTAHHFYSLQLSAFRRHEESLAHILSALQSDPLSLPINNFVGMMFFAARRYDEAIAAARKTVEMDPQFGLAHSVLGAALEAKGLDDEAANEYLASLEVGKHSAEECRAIRRAYDSRGMMGLHREDLRQSRQKWDGWHGQTFGIAALSAGVGDVLGALEFLERACDQRSGRLIWLNSGTTFARIAQYFDNLRSEPRFQDLLRRVHLPVAPLPSGLTALRGSGTL